MKTVTTNEEHVRLKVHEGDLHPENAGAELLRLALASHYRLEAMVRVAADLAFHARFSGFRPKPRRAVLSKMINDPARRKKVRT